MIKFWKFCYTVLCVSAGNRPVQFFCIFHFRVTFVCTNFWTLMYPPSRIYLYHGELQFFQICIQIRKITHIFTCVREKYGYFCKNGGVNTLLWKVSFHLKHICFFSFFNFFVNFFEIFWTRFRRTVALGFSAKNVKNND